MPSGKKQETPKLETQPLPGASAQPCDIDDVCRWLTAVAPGKNDMQPYPLPPEGPIPERQGSRNPWLKDMWECYAELYTAVARLERAVFCKDASITQPYIVDKNCGGGGGGPGRGGSPPPPPFP
jgi:hypothetical protein